MFKAFCGLILRNKGGYFPSSPKAGCNNEYICRQISYYEYKM